MNSILSVVTEQYEAVSSSREVNNSKQTTLISSGCLQISPELSSVNQFCVSSAFGRESWGTRVKEANLHPKTLTESLSLTVFWVNWLKLENKVLSYEIKNFNDCWVSFNTIVNINVKRIYVPLNNWFCRLNTSSSERFNTVFVPPPPHPTASQSHDHKPGVLREGCIFSNKLTHWHRLDFLSLFNSVKVWGEVFLKLAFVYGTRVFFRTRKDK